MASGFMILEDGRCWARRWTLFDTVLENICAEMTGQAEEFKIYLKTLLPNERDIEMGWGFTRQKDEETITRRIDLREFAPLNRTLFWEATQKAFSRLSKDKEIHEALIYGLELLLKMHKSINKGESPYQLTDWKEGYVEPETGNKIGPGW